MTVDITTRESKGGALTHAEADANFTNLKAAVEALQGYAWVPTSIESMTASGSTATVTYTDGTTNQFDLPMWVPASATDWQAATWYSRGSMVFGPLGTYIANVGHTSGTDFDADETAGKIGLFVKAGAAFVPFNDAPNDVIPVYQLQPETTAASADAVLSPVGGGALLAQVPDDTSAGGDKRGTRAVDWQLRRGASTQVASGTGSVVSGGENNTASQQYAAVGGGYTNTASEYASAIGGGDGNTASASAATVAGGLSNTASGINSAVSGGENNTAGGDNAAVSGGEDNTATGGWSTISGGWSNTASGESSFIPGGDENEATAFAAGAFGIGAQARVVAQVAHAAGYFVAKGDAQATNYVMRRQTADATATILTTDGNAPGTANQMLVPSDNSLWDVTGRVVALCAATGEAAVYDIRATMRRGTGVASVATVGTPAVTVVHEDVAAWDVTVSADTTNGALSITVTGEAAKSIRWLCRAEAVELIGA